MAKISGLVWSYIVLKCKRDWQLELVCWSAGISIMTCCLAYLWQISYASTSSVLSDRSLYPMVFRTVPSDEVLAPALATVMNYYQWRRISIVTESDQSQFVKVYVYVWLNPSWILISKLPILTLCLHVCISFAENCFSMIQMLLNGHDFCTQLGLLLADSFSSNNIATTFVNTSKNLSQTAQELFVSWLYTVMIVMYVHVCKKYTWNL